MSKWGQRTLGIAIVIGLVGVGFATLWAAPAESGTSGASAPPVRFGMDSGSVAKQASHGVKPDYAVVWVGAWMNQYTWDGFENRMKQLKGDGITPVVHLYYWGNDISRSCINNGCWSDTHNEWKDKAGWNRLTENLAKHLKSSLGGAQAVVILETEFNKNDVRTWETLDAMLASKAGYLKSVYASTKVVLGLGNWGSWEWGTWNRAAGASDYVGVQGMRGSTQDSKDAYYSVVPQTLDAAKKIKSLFGKPVFLTDIALSSYPYSEYATHQAEVLQRFFNRMDDLKAAGVRAFVYRSLINDPNYNPNEYYGRAEGGFGLIKASGGWKPAMQVWIDGVKAERNLRVAYVEAESFSDRSVGGRAWDGGASGDAFWNVWSNGCISDVVDLPSGGTYLLRVRALGDRAGGDAPRMVVKFDGEPVLTKKVWATSFKIHDAWAWTDSPGKHRVAVCFTNDYYANGQDRNLWVDRLVVRNA